MNPATLTSLASTPAGPCGANGTDIDGDGSCFDWEGSLQHLGFAQSAVACRKLLLTAVRRGSPTTLKISIAVDPNVVGTTVQFRVTRASTATAVPAHEIASQPATITSENPADPAAPLSATVTLNQPLSSSPIATDPQKTPLPFVVVDAVSAATDGPVHCEQPMSRWLPRQLTPEPNGLHGPYASLNELLGRDAAPVWALAQTLKTNAEYGFRVVRDWRLPNGGYYATAPRRSSDLGTTPVLLFVDYDSSLHKAFDGSCEDLSEFVIVSAVHTHPDYFGVPNNFTMVDFNLAIKTYQAGADSQGRSSGVNFFWGHDHTDRTWLEAIAVVTGRNRCALRFAALAGDDPFLDALALTQQQFPFITTPDYHEYTTRTNTFIPA